MYLGGIKSIKAEKCHYIVAVFHSVFARCFPRLQSPNTQIGPNYWIVRVASGGRGLELPNLQLGYMLGGHGCTALLSWLGVHVCGKATWLLEATQGLK
jgi:hypothetical protein